jgi:hypothetical protein
MRTPRSSSSGPAVRRVARGRSGRARVGQRRYSAFVAGAGQEAGGSSEGVSGWIWSRRKEVVITGGAGLGQAVVDAFVAAGARCHLPVRGRETDGARAGVAITTGVDLTDEAAVSSYYAQLPRSGRRAPGRRLRRGADRGAGAGRSAPAAGDEPGHRLPVRARGRPQHAAHAGAGGRIVQVSSRAGLVPAGGSIAYAVSKRGSTCSPPRWPRRSRVTASWSTPWRLRPSTRPPTGRRCPARNRTAGPLRRPRGRHHLLASPANRLTSGAVIPVYGRS